VRETGGSFYFRSRSSRLTQALVQCPLEFGQVRLPAVVRKLDRLSTRERPELVRQLVLTWHTRTAHQNRDDDSAAVQAGCDFAAYEVGGIIEATSSSAIRCAEPLRTDQSDQEIRAADAVFDDAGEILAGCDVSDVHEHCVGAKPLNQSIE